MYICIGIYIFKFEPSALFHLSRAHQTFVSPSCVVQRSPTDIRIRSIRPLIYLDKTSVVALKDPIDPYIKHTGEKPYII